jgi:hypothetical protein
MWCAIGERRAIFNEINATYPEWHREYLKGKTQTAGYNAGL